MLFSFISFHLTLYFICSLWLFTVVSSANPTGVAVRRSAGDHPVLCGGPRFPHQEPSHVPQGHGGHHPQPGAPGRGLDGRLQEDLLSPQQQRRHHGQRGQSDVFNTRDCHHGLEIQFLFILNENCFALCSTSMGTYLSAWS